MIGSGSAASSRSADRPRDGEFISNDRQLHISAVFLFASVLILEKEPMLFRSLHHALRKSVIGRTGSALAHEFHNAEHAVEYDDQKSMCRDFTVKDLTEYLQDYWKMGNGVDMARREMMLY